MMQVPCARPNDKRRVICDFVRADKNASRFRCVPHCGIIIIMCHRVRGWLCMCENEFLSGPIQVNRVPEREKGAPVSSFGAASAEKTQSINWMRIASRNCTRRGALTLLVWEKTQFCSKQHARVIAQIYYVRLFVFNRRMCSIATPKNVGGKNDGQCRFKRAEIRQ